MNALKEWATVVNALENGDQTVLLRKGGILEDSSGFVVESEKFFLFPTCPSGARCMHINRSGKRTNKEVQEEPSVISDEAMSNIKDSSTWIDAVLVVVYLVVFSYSILALCLSILSLMYWTVLL